MPISMTNNSRFFKLLLTMGVLTELAIFFISYITFDSIEETFRHAARYSGRLSLVIFLYAFYLFATSHPKPIKNNPHLNHIIKLFAILHVIHFGFLATNVYLNNIPLEIPKLIGGALAYLMIVAAPFKLQSLKFNWQLVYFYYVGLVMALTYVARIKGDFEGAEPFWFHYVAVSTLVITFLVFGVFLKKGTNTKNQSL